MRGVVFFGLGLVLCGGAAWVRHAQHQRAAALSLPREDPLSLGLRVLTAVDAAQARAGLATLQQEADHGDADADVALGRIYRTGAPTVGRDPTRAMRHFTRAAAAHQASASYYLGVMVQAGEGIAPDVHRAAELLTTAATGGCAPAMLLLGNAYRTGLGVPRDDRRALELYRRAGERGNATALQTLGMAYQYGELGLVSDEAEARRYLMEAGHAAHEPTEP